MKNQIILFACLFVLSCGFSQTNNYWKESVSSEEKNTKILNQVTYTLSVEKLKKVLANCPKRFNSFGKSNVIVALPAEGGKFKEYRIKETNVLHPDLAKKFPDIKSYVGTSVSGENEVVHFSLSNNNFRAMIMKPDATIANIKPSTSNSKTYIVTSKTDGLQKPIDCQTVDDTTKIFSEKNKKQTEKSNQVKKSANDGLVRVYRMAIAVTGELSKIYTDAANVTNGSTQQRKAAVLAELNELMTRVNAVYERDLGTTFELVPNIENSIFLDPATDGITHGNTGISINESQGVLDAAIGNANYDIGHVLDSDGTGRGALNSVCVDSKKAEGSTGAHPFTSVADYFFRTFVHEIGHQFGANHSFNNSCGGNRLDEGAVEPGGGNSIMAYTGCAPNTENTQYVFFHAKQIDEMWNHIVNTAGCGTTKSVGNSAPTASIGGNYTIPRSTPFILEGSATDVNTAADQLTYTWNQMDKEIAPMPPRATSTGGPLFRYKPPSASSNRYMPNLTTIKAGNASSEWEVVPSVARTMNFRFTVRDNHPGGGNTDTKDAVITVSGTAGPFVVTSQNTRFDAPVGSTQTVTWNVAGTTGNGVNAATVDILLSTDGGNTYPISLASAVPNDGSHQITIPDNQGGVNRIMVRGTNNIFFDITNANFSITDGNSAPMPTDYCDAGFQGSNYIDEVIFGDINNKSGNSGYSDFTNLGTNLVKGESVALTVNPGIDFHDPNYFGAWIDWNKDGDFTDAGEEVLLKTNGPGGVTTTVVVPNTAQNGATRLRVRYKIHTSPEPCGTTSATGNEVEDYFVFIIGESSSPTCNDGTQNGDETGVDCGGSCAPCDTIPPNVTYCDITSSNNTDDYITNVNFAGINNTSVRATTNGYDDYTSGTVASVSSGSSYNLKVTFVGYQGGASNEVYAWFDWNADGDFTDTGEKFNVTTAPSNAVRELSIAVPSTATTGTTRMRIALGYNAADGNNSCGIGAIAYGEIEDYNISISGGGTPTPTCSDGIQNGTETGVDCGGSCPPCQSNVVYCSATGNDGPEGVSNVEFAGINNASTRNATGYDDFTSISTSVNVGASYNLKVNIIGYQGGANDEIYAWFDWNSDGDFTDAGEFYTLTKTNNLLGSVSVTVPQAAINGLTRMRVLVSYYDTENNSCNTGANDVRYGEYEDYTLNIFGSSLVKLVYKEKIEGIKTNTNIINVHPNPVTDGKININFNSSEIGEVQMELYDVAGMKIFEKREQKGSERVKTIELNRSLLAGVYFLKVRLSSEAEAVITKIMIK
ncbi:GEVED domain-containing protein [uncultured Lacinutrix sp.]|uniref:GEVED domain-containing protein n=1 Tax=uncultured Lacinutrix sp. TaxID=574032 RepID=UPI002635F0B6|nr:GEVED domain-containing protein [uncultured Lacinutrix sp.]